MTRNSQKNEIRTKFKTTQTATVRLNTVIIAIMSLMYQFERSRIRAYRINDAMWFLMARQSLWHSTGSCWMANSHSCLRGGRRSCRRWPRRRWTACFSSSLQRRTVRICNTNMK